MDDLILIEHAQGAPGLRLFGIGPGLQPVHGIRQLIKLFDENTSWAQNRSRKQIQSMLSGSKVIVSGWHNNDLVAFGRATTDKTFRAVLWDIVVDKKYENHGIGRKLISSIIENPNIIKTEKIYATQNFVLKYLKNQLQKKRTQRKRNADDGEQRHRRALQIRLRGRLEDDFDNLAFTCVCPKSVRGVLIRALGRPTIDTKERRHV